MIFPIWLDDLDAVCNAESHATISCLADTYLLAAYKSGFTPKQFLALTIPARLDSKALPRREPATRRPSIEERQSMLGVNASGCNTDYQAALNLPPLKRGSTDGMDVERLLHRSHGACS